MKIEDLQFLDVIQWANGKRAKFLGIDVHYPDTSHWLAAGGKVATLSNDVAMLDAVLVECDGQPVEPPLEPEPEYPEALCLKLRWPDVGTAVSAYVCTDHGTFGAAYAGIRAKLFGQDGPTYHLDGYRSDDKEPLTDSGACWSGMRFAVWLRVDGEAQP